MERGFVIPLHMHRLSWHGMHNDTLPKLACSLPNALLNAEKLWAAESLPYEQWGSEQCSRSPWGGSPTCCRCQHTARCEQHCSRPSLPCQGFVASSKVGVLGGTTSSQKLSAENTRGQPAPPAAIAKYCGGSSVQGADAEFAMEPQVSHMLPKMYLCGLHIPCPGDSNCVQTMGLQPVPA